MDVAKGGGGSGQGHLKLPSPNPMLIFPGVGSRMEILAYRCYAVCLA